MRSILFLAVFLSALQACKNESIPDVSNIKVDLKIQRFEDDLFAIDTLHMREGLSQLQQKYPAFYVDFLQHMLGYIPMSDSSISPEGLVQIFIRDYRPLYDSSKKVFSSTEDLQNTLSESLKFVKYYFPQYPLPDNLITYIGPMDAYYEATLGGYSDVITTAGLATGLQLHMGSTFSMYQSAIGQSLYPNYISRRFTPETIPVNAIKNIIDDLYPDQSSGKTLIEQMVEKGKRLYVLDRLMPYTDDSLKIGYPAEKLKGCFENEGRIWNFFMSNQLLLSKDPGQIKSFITDGPKTIELGEQSPGYIGLFVGWQIVNKFMHAHKELTLPELLKTDAKKIFDESKYRPK